MNIAALREQRPAASHGFRCKKSGCDMMKIRPAGCFNRTLPMKIKLSIVGLIFACVLAGCAGYRPPADLIGQSRADLISRMGQPEREYPSPAGQKLHYPRGPAGSHTYFVYLDSSDRVIRWEQVLTEERFGTIRPGMTREQVRQVLGAPLLNPLFRPDRWDYVFRYQYPNGRAELRRVALIFKDDQITTIRADTLPASEAVIDPALPGYKPPAGERR